MKTRMLFVAMFAVAVLYVAACGPSPEAIATQTATAATAIAASWTATPTNTPTPTSASTATVTTGLTATGQPTQSPVELVWSITGDPNPFNTPDGLALDPQGNLYVTDSGNHRIQKFDSDGRFITTWGGKGNDDGQFDCQDICMVAVDGQGYVYITDNNNARVQKFDSNGKFLAKWGSFGDGDGQFNGPFGLAVDRQSHLYCQPPAPEFLVAQQAFAAAHPWFKAQRLEAHSHFPMFEIPDEIAEAIETFVA